MDAGDFFVPSRSDLPGITCLSLSVTLISDCGSSGLTDRPLHGKMGYPRNLRDWQITHLVEAAGFWELCPVSGTVWMNYGRADV